MRAVNVLLSSLFAIAFWLSVKYGLDISDRYLPGVESIGNALTDIGPAWINHGIATFSRTLIGFILAVAAGLGFALGLYRLRALSFIMPIVHSLRAVPPAAFIPFFLLWFGFSEIGRYVLVVAGIGLNVTVAAADVLENPSDRDRQIFSNFRQSMNSNVISYWLPRIAEGLLPTLRFGIALALGVITVSEMLGAQTGLGYLMQTARATFSLNVIFVCAIVLGIMAALFDAALKFLWSFLVDWKS